VAFLALALPPLTDLRAGDGLRGSGGGSDLGVRATLLRGFSICASLKAIRCNSFGPGFISQLYKYVVVM
jgi:hypothetical protein